MFPYVIETLVEVWENSKLRGNTRGSLGELEIAWKHLPLQFLVLPNFHSCFYNCGNTENVFCWIQKDNWKSFGNLCVNTFLSLRFYHACANVLQRCFNTVLCSSFVRCIERNYWIRESQEFKMAWAFTSTFVQHYSGQMLSPVKYSVREKKCSFIKFRKNSFSVLYKVSKSVYIYIYIYIYIVCWQLNLFHTY